MREEKLLEGRFQAWIFQDKILKISSLGAQHKMIHRPNRGDGDGFIIFIVRAERSGIIFYLRTNIFDGLINAIFTNVNPREPQVRFVAKQRGIERAAGKLLFKSKVIKGKVLFHIGYFLYSETLGALKTVPFNALL